MNRLQRILYVDDDPDLRTLAKIVLEMDGQFTVKICANGQEAANTGAEFAPDLIVLDVIMSGMDGPATLAKLRELPSLAAVPAVFMTAKAQPQDIAKFKSLGALGVIAKPFDPMTLVEQLKTLWNERGS